MKKILTLALGALALSITSCDSVDKDNRFVYVEPQYGGKNVLIEDFTGQKCVNCPLAHEDIEHIQKQYGSDKVIAVSIHSGPLAVHNNPKIPKIMGLATETGDEYYKFWKVEAAPMGLVNRIGGVTTRFNWAGQVNAEWQKAPTVALNVQNTYNDATRQLTISIEAMGLKKVDGKLQVWITEDDITAIQLMPDGKVNNSYVHHNVFRTAVNGAWGTDFSVNEGGTTRVTFTTQINESWKSENLAVVAFVYNNDGVQQVMRQKIK